MSKANHARSISAHPDAKLLALLAEERDLARRLTLLNAKVDALSEREGRWTIERENAVYEETGLNRLSDQHHQLCDRIVETPAYSLGGFVGKALIVAQIQAADCPQGDEPYVESTCQAMRLAQSILRDLVALRGEVQP